MDSLTVATTAVACLAPYLVRAGEKAVEEVGKKLLDFAANMWKAITARLKGSPAAEEAVQDFAAKPEDQLTQSAFANQLRKILEAQPAFTAELVRLIDGAQCESGDTIIVTGSGAAATRGGLLPVRVAWPCEGMSMAASARAAWRRKGKSPCTMMRAWTPSNCGRPLPYLKPNSRI